MNKEQLYVVFKELNPPWQLVRAVSEKQAIYFAKQTDNWEDPALIVEDYSAHCIGDDNRFKTERKLNDAR